MPARLSRRTYPRPITSRATSGTAAAAGATAAGAAGRCARIRSLASSARPPYTGISFVETDLFDADTRHPRSAAVIGGGFFIALGHERGVLAHRETDGSLHVDRVHAEWNNKAVGLVSYGFDGGVRAVEALRPVLGALQLADVSATVTLNLRTDFADFGATFTPGDHQGPALTAMLDQLLSWSNALACTRNSAASAAS